MLELSSAVQKRPMKMLLDSDATSNFLSDAMVAALGLPIREEEFFHELTLADRTVVPTAGSVQFMMNCGDYKGRIVARVYPNL